VVTAWLAEELGPEAMLVHPDALWLWLPLGLDPALATDLARFRLEPAVPEFTEPAAATASTTS
jgi:hypothetical protein